jgi:hypothetical protein
MLRDNRGRFIKGNEGFWTHKKRPDVSGSKNWRWVGGDTIKICLICGNKFPTRGKRRITGRFCSKACKAKWLFTGSKNINWKGGIPREKREQLPEYRDWRSRVYKRDKWQCKICGYKGRQLIAHHIKTYKTSPELRLDIGNGITLCRACHCKLHTIHKKIIDFTEILRDYTLNSERR